MPRGREARSDRRLRQPHRQGSSGPRRIANLKPHNPVLFVEELRAARTRERARGRCRTWLARFHRSRPRLARVVASARRLIRSVKILARHGRIPKPLRGLVAFGLLPIPGPVDEVALLIVALCLYLFYRQPIREAWTEARDAPS
jgi:hypothetical protein